MEGADVHLMRLRLSSTGKDVELSVRLSETISSCKIKLAAKTCKTPRQRWFYGGRLIEDKIKVRDLGIPHDHVIQVVFNEPLPSSGD
jgi:hypothetical protein